MDKDFWKYFISALGTIASLVTLITFLYNWRAECIDSVTLISLAVLILGICWGYGLLMTRRKNSIEIVIHPSFKLKITFGDLFNPMHHGIIVIPVNQYFDTQLSDALVSHNSVLGTFIRIYWQDRIDELDNKIQNALTNVLGVRDDSRGVGKEIKYDLGTCADIRDGENIYVLVVTTEKDSNGMSVLSKNNYPKVIGKLFKHLAEIRPTRTIFMPMFGAGRGRMKRSLQRILSFLLDTLNFEHSDLSIPGGVTIIVKQTFKNEVNLNEIEHHFENALKD